MNTSDYGYSDYSMLNPNQTPDKPNLLTKMNPILQMRMTEFPQYKSALTPEFKMKMARQDASQLQNVLTKDNDLSSFYTVNNMSKRNAFYKST